MLKLVKILSFAAICGIAAYAGSNLAKAQGQGWACYTWQCQGNVTNCWFFPNQYVQGCYASTPNTCTVVGTNTCYGQYPDGKSCFRDFLRCDPPLP